MRILAIETSCDDTGVAILKYDKNSPPELLVNLVFSQIKIHAPFGGVVPMLAKREHQKNLVPILRQALKESGFLIACHPEGVARRISREYGQQTRTSREILRSAQNDETLKIILEREPELLKKLKPFLKKYQKPKIDLIAVTIGPGLEPALWVGVNFARALAYFWNLPIIPVNHIEAHIIANWLPEKKSLPTSLLQREEPPSLKKRGWGRFFSDKRLTISDKPFPAVCLVVSGGHTQLILIKKFGRYEILGETRDDAAGEAFDKLAKMLGLGYPGGPIISQIAKKYGYPEAQSAEGSPTNVGNEVPHAPASLSLQRGEREIPRYSRNDTIKLPRPMIHSGNLDLSFSGLKTAALYLIKKLSPAQIKKLTPAICAEFQQAVVDVLTAKTIAAAKKYQAKTIMLSGGVAANDLLRDTLSLSAKRLFLNFLTPPKNFCTDNAAMIALAAYQKNQRKASWQNLKADANLRV